MAYAKNLILTWWSPKQLDQNQINDTLDKLRLHNDTWAYDSYEADGGYINQLGVMHHEGHSRYFINSTLKNLATEAGLKDFNVQIRKSWSKVLSLVQTPPVQFQAEGGAIYIQDDVSTEKQQCGGATDTGIKEQLHVSTSRLCFESVESAIKLLIAACSSLEKSIAVLSYSLDQNTIAADQLRKISPPASNRPTLVTRYRRLLRSAIASRKQDLPYREFSRKVALHRYPPELKSRIKVFFKGSENLT